MNRTDVQRAFRKITIKKTQGKMIPYQLLKYGGQYLIEQLMFLIRTTTNNQMNGVPALMSLCSRRGQETDLKLQRFQSINATLKLTTEDITNQFNNLRTLADFFINDLF